jgi:hypothetical protein
MSEQQSGLVREPTEFVDDRDTTDNGTANDSDAHASSWADKSFNDVKDEVERGFDANIDRTRGFIAGVGSILATAFTVVAYSITAAAAILAALAFATVLYAASERVLDATIQKLGQPGFVGDDTAEQVDGKGDGIVAIDVEPDPQDDDDDGETDRSDE